MMTCRNSTRITPLCCIKVPFSLIIIFLFNNSQLWQNASSDSYKFFIVFKRGCIYTTITISLQFVNSRKSLIKSLFSYIYLLSALQGCQQKSNINNKNAESDSLLFPYTYIAKDKTEFLRTLLGNRSFLSCIIEHTFCVQQELLLLVWMLTENCIYLLIIIRKKKYTTQMLNMLLIIIHIKVNLFFPGSEMIVYL